MFGLFSKRQSGHSAIGGSRPEATQEAQSEAQSPSQLFSWHAPMPELARIMPSASWTYAEDLGVACVCCDTPHAGMVYASQTLCITCASVLSLDREGLDARAEPIWLPFISQAALNRIIGAHLRACRPGSAGVQVKETDKFDVEPGRKQFAHLLQDARRTAQERLGNVSASELVSAWRNLDAGAYENLTAIRFLATGVWQNELERNIFPEILMPTATGHVSS